MVWGCVGFCGSIVGVVKLSVGFLKVLCGWPEINGSSLTCWLMTVSGSLLSVRMAVFNCVVRLWMVCFGVEKLDLMECHTLEVY